MKYAKAYAVIWEDEILRLREAGEDHEPIAFLIDGVLYPSPAHDRYGRQIAQPAYLKSFSTIGFAPQGYGDELEEEPETEN